MPSPIVSVTQLDQYIKGIFDAEELLHGIRVEGEVSGYSVKANNAYFTLKDTNAQIQCCCFSVSKTIAPKDGDNVILTGRPDFYVKTGKLSFIAEKIEQKGYGQLFQEFLALKQKLLEEGLFDAGKKKLLPEYVRNLCVITSHQGAVVQDILSTIYQKTKNINVTAVDVRVQGVGAVDSIVWALRTADTMSFDTIILARGGGSFEDLMPFNTEEIARCIAAMQTPIISAIGHETDVTLCDYAADVRALTPTAAAETVVAGHLRALESFRALKQRLYQKMQSVIENLSQEVLNQKRLLRLFTDKILLGKKSQLQILSAKLQSNDPNKLLQNGYVAVEKDKKRIYSLCDITENDTVKLFFKDGAATAKIERKE